MAGPPCMTEDGNQSVFVGTFLETGQAVNLCDECLPAFMASVLGAMTDTPVQALEALVYGDLSVAEASTGAPTDEPPPPPPFDLDDGQDDDVEAEGEAAEWVSNGTPPPTSPAGRGRSRSGRSSAAADTGGDKADDSE